MAFALLFFISSQLWASADSVGDDSDSISDEQETEYLDLNGNLQSGQWLIPHVTYRGLNFWEYSSGPANDSSLQQMQAEAGFTAQIDKEGKYLAAVAWEQDATTEYYLRLEADKTWALYAGLMKKVFGIRNIDHTSYQSTYQGFNLENDTSDGSVFSEGFILQKTEDKWEASLNYFFGNPYEASSLKQKGLSVSGEFEIAEKKRLGASIMTEKSDVLEKNLLAVFYRQDLSKGSTVMLEGGLVKDKTADDGEVTVGSYEMLQTLVELTRGYSVEASLEHYNTEFDSTSPDNWKWRVGVIASPRPNLVLKFDVVNERQISSLTTQEDDWQVQGQVTVAL
ncbi:hypothetical protein DOE51_18090 [Bdellovibrio sp. NC01]|nr:hypothetical protein DOE51_18090 [Bdellovibrio sp. NC01]